MARCLFVFPNAPLSSNFSGGASRYVTSFQSLCRLGVEVHVWRILSENLVEQIYARETREAPSGNILRRLAVSWDDVIYFPSPMYKSRLDLLFKALFSQIELTFSEPTTLREKFLQAANTMNPDFVWAEWGSVGALAASSGLTLPWVYAHHDMYHRLLKARQDVNLRRPYLSERIHLYAMQRGEKQIVRRASAILAGSQTEAVELESMGGKNVNVIPTAYDPVALSFPDKPPVEPARIFHLGSLCTTANYLGLLSYLEKVQPRLAGMQNGQDDLFRLHVIGEIEGAKPALLEELRACGTHFYGHVDDLATVLRPFDIVIIPYERDTGTRTKLPLLFNYAQVVVATCAAVAGSPEVRSGENCIVLPDCQAFSEALFELVHDGQERMRIGLNARRTFESEFTFDAQVPKYERVLEQII